MTMLRETIYNYSPFSQEEQRLLLSPVGDAGKDRRKRGVLFEHIDDPMTEDEYMLYKSNEDKFYDLFLLFRHRGKFEKAYEYEKLVGFDEVKEFENIPRDMFIKNEYEYYKWRKSKM